MYSTDSDRWRVRATVDKYDSDQSLWALNRASAVWLPGDQLRAMVGPPSGSVAVNGNMLLTAGVTRLMSLFTGAGGQALTNTATRVGVGTSTATEAMNQTDLQAPAGAANRWFQVMDATYPQQTSGVITAKGTFGVSDANFAWNEWGIDIGNPTVTSGTTVNSCLVNRKRVTLDVKAQGTMWVFTVTLTIG